MSSTRSWFLKSRRAEILSGAFIGAPWLGRDQHGTFLDLAVMHRREHAIDVVERVGFDERLDLHLGIEHEVECGGVGLGRAAPVADRTRVERHQVPVSYTHLRAHETDSYLVCRL